MALSGAGVSKVLVDIVPLYFALALGYCFGRWKNISPVVCDALNQFVASFVFPFFLFEFVVNTDPYKWNYRAIAGDAIAKAILIVFLAAWAKFSKNGSYAWFITSFSLSILTNALVIGVPLLDALYGNWAGDLVVQLAVFQALTWLMVLLFLLEWRKALQERNQEMVELEITRQVTNSCHENASEEEEARNETDDVGSGSTQVVATNDLESGNSTQAAVTRRFSVGSLMKVVRGKLGFVGSLMKVVGGKLGFVGSLMKAVVVKLALDPNFHANLIGIIVALVVSRYHLKLHGIMAVSVHIVAACVDEMANLGRGVAMFSMGTFMATQTRFIACGYKLTLSGMALRFLAGPVAMAIGCYAAGLRGDVLRVAIIQAAVPQSITSFAYAQEYKLHPEVISTAVILGMFVSLPLLVLYYVLLGFV